MILCRMKGPTDISMTMRQGLKWEILACLCLMGLVGDDQVTP